MDQWSDLVCSSFMRLYITYHQPKAVCFWGYLTSTAVHISRPEWWPFKFLMGGAVILQTLAFQYPWKVSKDLWNLIMSYCLKNSSFIMNSYSFLPWSSYLLQITRCPRLVLLGLWQFLWFSLLWLGNGQKECALPQGSNVMFSLEIMDMRIRPGVDYRCLKLDWGLVIRFIDGNSFSLHLWKLNALF